MGFTNNKTDLLNYIEKMLGLIPLRDILPEPYNKDSWMKEVILPISLVSFSTYYPLEVPYVVDKCTKKKNGWYFVDEAKIANAKIIGIKDIDWSTVGRDSLFYQSTYGYGIYDPYVGAYGVDDIMMGQMRADIASLYNVGIYPKFEEPNKFKIEGLFDSDITKNIGTFKITVLVYHSDSLLTIPATKMELFKSLCTADTATYLVANLKHFENIESVYAQVQLRLDDLRDWASKSETIREEMKSNFVSAENPSVPLIMSI